MSRCLAARRDTAAPAAYLLFLPVGCPGGLAGLGLIGAGGGGRVVTCDGGGLCPPLFSYPRCASGGTLGRSWEELFIGALLIYLWLSRELDINIVHWTCDVNSGG